MSKLSTRNRRVHARSPEPPLAVAVPPEPRPRWLSYSTLALTAILIFYGFWQGIGDGDFWWHLKTGQYIAQNHKLPVPDPFAYTTYLHPDTYPGESGVRYFNLTHEWLAQLTYYGAYSLAGAAGVASLRSLLILLQCLGISLVVWRRTGGFYRAIAAALIAMSSSSFSAGERPYLFTYFFLVAVIAILEYRRFLWALPFIFVIWSNCHAGYFLGWVVLGAYVAEALVRRWRGVPDPGERALFIFAVICFLASGINPNGFHVIETLVAYRRSPLQTSITEWQRPKYWEVTSFTIVLYASFGMLLWARRRARISDWILYLLFAAASLTAVRNIVLSGIIGAIILTAYVPVFDPVRFFPRVRSLPAILGAAAALFLAYRIVSQPPHRLTFEDDWRFSQGSADFLLNHHVTARLFNSYESGGYLIWRLWPQEQVFIDGRALSETAFNDYKRIAFNADAANGPSGEQLLRQYNIGVIYMPMIDNSGQVYLLPASLSDPSLTEWKLVYADAKGVIYMKTPPAGVTPLDPSAALSSMEAQCNLMLEQSGDDCARGVARLYSRIGNKARSDYWNAMFQSRGGAANARYGGR